MSFDDSVTVPMVSDSLDRLGVRDRASSGGFIPLSGAGRVSGSAATVQFAPAGELGPHDPYGAMIDFIDGLCQGEVVVIATGGSRATAFWGELFSAAARGRGAAGVLSDGPVRDLEKIAALGFTVFAPATAPHDYRGRMRVVGTRGRVSIGGIEIENGDHILADRDGVVAVPAARRAEVEAAANERAAGESTVLAELLAGDGLRSVWERHGIL